VLDLVDPVRCCGGQPGGAMGMQAGCTVTTKWHVSKVPARPIRQAPNAAGGSCKLSTMPRPVPRHHGLSGTISHEHYSTLRDMALQANKSMVLDARNRKHCELFLSSPLSANVKCWREANYADTAPNC
jgi:hypothetical protein